MSLSTTLTNKVHYHIATNQFLYRTTVGDLIGLPDSSLKHATL